MQLAVQAMLADALRNLRERDPRVVEEVASRGEDIERLFWMVAKVTDPVVTAQRARNSAVRSTDGQPHGAVAKLLKRMSGQVVRLAEGLLVIRPNDPKETKLLADLEATGTAIAQILDKACEAVQNTDVELATEAIESRERLEETLNALPRRLSHHRPSDALHVTIVAESLHRTADCAAEIAEHAVDLALSQT